MTFLARFRFAAPFFAAALLAGGALAGTPTPVDFPAATAISDLADLTKDVVTPVIPTTKVLVIPVTAYDPDGGRLTFTATSDNPDVSVRVRTGNPVMRLTVNHAGDPNNPTTDPSYSGDLVFQLYRQLAPQTTGFIGGFAESGYYDGLTFHRLADLNAANEAANTPGAVPSWIYQGGDPNGDGTGGPGFTFSNELDTSLIFSGRGMLAMANSGVGSDYRGTDGSQFFITDGRVTLNSDGSIKTDGRCRELDFGYTIFAQMTHGWPLLDNLMNTPTGNPATTKPTIAVNISSATVVDQYMDPSGHVYTDASLFLSAVPPKKSGQTKKTSQTAHITVAMSDNQTPPHTTKQTFLVEAVDDTTNDPPFFVPLANQELDGDKEMALRFGIIDLERDFVGNFGNLITSLSSSVTNTSSSGDVIGFSEIINNDTVIVLPNSQFQNTSGPAGYNGPLDLLLGVTQYDMTYRGAIEGFTPQVNSYAASTIAVGDASFTPIPTTITGTAGSQISNAVVAKYQTGSTRSQTGDVAALINWGDGNSSGSQATLAPDGGALGRYQILGTHTYTRPGIYEVLVTFSDSTLNGKANNGLSATARSTAIVTAGAITPVGRTLDVKGRDTGKVTVATFTDTSGPGAYTAQIDWGDGLLSNGSIVSSPSGTYSVTGSHTYVDPETFPILVHVKKNGDTNAADSVSAWSMITVSGFTGKPHLPPYDQAHLVARWSPVTTSSGTSFPTKATVNTATSSQTYLSYQLFILNTGNVTSKLGSLSCYLSLDKELNLTAGTNSDGTPNPADIPLTFGPTHKKLAILALKPGEALEYTFDKNAAGDFRLTPPPNKWVSAGAPGSKKVPTDITTGNNLLAVMDYDDPIADHEPIGKTGVAGTFDGILLNGLLGTAPSLTTTQDAGTNTHTASYSVKLDRQPTQPVTITFTVAPATETINGGQVQVVEGSITPTAPTDPPTSGEAEDSSMPLQFNSTNWNVPQMVYVTGVPNSDTSAQSYAISASVTSSDPYYSGMQVPSVSVSNQSSLFTVTPLNLIVYRTPNTINSATFSVALAQTPVTTVTLPVVSGNEAGTVDKSTLSFAPNAATTAQVVTVTAPASAEVGSVVYQVELGPAGAVGDTRFNQRVPPAVTVVTEDYPFIVTPSPVTVYRNSGVTGAASFSIALATQPAASVTIPVASGTATAGTTSSSVLVFTPTNYSTPQTVNITAKDQVGSGVANYSVLLGPASSSDINYSGAPILPLSVTNKDNPILVSALALTTTEDSGSPPPTATFTVVLASAPSDTVTIPVSSNNLNEGTVDQASLTFTPDNYATAQTVTITGVNDGGQSGTQVVYQVLLGPAQSNDQNYNGVPVPSVSVTNVNP